MIGYLARDTFKNKLKWYNYKMKNNKFWFVNKTYGYGWTPSTWEGWLVLLLWLILFIPLTMVTEKNWILSIVGILFATGLLMYVCYKKGEKPRWQWGEEKDLNKKNEKQ